MHAYIDILSEHILMPHHTLSERDLRLIGEFTRENISRWLERGKGAAIESWPDRDFYFDLGVYGWKDFHAVCGDIEIPWAKEESRLAWNRTR